MAPFLCTIDATTKITKKGIQCDECTTKCKTWSSLVHHYQAKHGYSLSDMSGHFICDQAAKEKANEFAMDPLEYANVAAVPNDIEKFKCKQCDVVLSKRSALAHFTEGTKHCLPKDEVSNWIVIKDANAIQNKRLHLCVLHLFDEHKEQQHSEAHQDDGDDGDEQSTTIGPKPSEERHFKWVEMTCLVKCDLDGEPLEPLECKLMRDESWMAPKSKACARPPASSTDTAYDGEAWLLVVGACWLVEWWLVFGGWCLVVDGIEVCCWLLLLGALWNCGWRLMVCGVWLVEWLFVVCGWCSVVCGIVVCGWWLLLGCCWWLVFGGLQNGGLWSVHGALWFVEWLSVVCGLCFAGLFWNGCMWFVLGAWLLVEL